MAHDIWFAPNLKNIPPFPHPLPYNLCRQVVIEMTNIFWSSFHLNIDEY